MSREATLEPGEAVADVAAASMQGVVRPTAPQTADGAVSAATSYLGWFLAAPGARSEPEAALTQAAPDLPPLTAQSMVSSLRLGEASEVDTSRGAYRVLGWSGEQERPEQVMVAVALPVRPQGAQRWLGFSVVLSWSDGGWQLAGAQPLDLGETGDSYDSAGALPGEVAGSVLTGPGWSTFANGE